MPATTYLQIQGGDTETARVVELTGGSIRIGRGAVCEVRLPEATLAEVQCLIRRRGEGWQVQPIGPSALMSLGGNPFDRLTPLPTGMTLRVGGFRLTLGIDAGDGFHSPIDVPARLDTPMRVQTTADADAERLSRWEARKEQRDRWAHARQDEKRWEARWRAAGESIRSRGSTTHPARPEPAPPSVRRVEVSRAASPLASEDVAAIPPTRPTARAIEPPQSRKLVTFHTAAPAEPRRTPVDPQPRSETARPEPRPAPPSIPRQIEEPPPAAPTAEAIEAPLTLTAASPPAADLGTDRVDAALEAGAALFKSISSTSPFFVTAPPPTIEVATPAPSPFWQAESLRVEIPDEVRSPRPAPAVRQVAPRVSPAPATGPGPKTVEFPSAASILAAQGTRIVAAPSQPARRTLRAARRPLPTDPIEPGQWTLPTWAALPPITVVLLGMAGLGLTLGLAWTRDNSSAGLAARAALRTGTAKPVAIDPTERPEMTWWKTTAGHLGLWAVAIERSPEAASRADEVRDALDAAHRAAPLEPVVRHALAQTVAGGEPLPAAWSVGLTRDVDSLRLTGRALKRAGKAEPSLRAYRHALELAAEVPVSRLDPPAFDDDPQVRRYRLPHEGLIARVVRDMMDAGDWTYAEWSAALPTRAVVRLAAGRLLRERSLPDSARAFEAALGVKIVPAPGSLEEAEHYAAEAEALALLDRKPDAAGRYRRAIELVADGPTQRRWRLGLAEILSTQGATGERAELLEAAKGTDATDEVSRKALEVQKDAGLK
jgi:hypothetical protein